MIVHLQQIGPDGESFSGVEHSDILGLDEPGLKSSSPVSYDIHVGLSGGGLFATGRLEVLLDCVCVRCLEPFQARITVDNFAIQEDLRGPETFDLSPFFREEILLALPAHPQCDRDGGLVCQPHNAVAATNPPSPESHSGDIRWGALDQLQPPKARDAG